MEERRESLKELSTENQSMQVLMNLKLKLISDLSLNKDAVKMFLDFLYLTLIGLDKMELINILNALWSMLLILPLEMIQELTGFVDLSIKEDNSED